VFLTDTVDSHFPDVRSNKTQVRHAVCFSGHLRPASGIAVRRNACTPGEPICCPLFWCFACSANSRNSCRRSTSFAAAKQAGSQAWSSTYSGEGALFLVNFARVVSQIRLWSSVNCQGPSFTVRRLARYCSVAFRSYDSAKSRHESWFETETA